MTKQIRISNFSCIDAAEIEISALTILIGPQASGKSIISKLIYFCNNILSEQYVALDESKSLVQFQKELQDSFREWFPVSAWGNRRFVIEYSAGPYAVYIERTNAKQESANNLRIRFSDYFTELYNASADFLEAAIAKVDPEKRKISELGRDIDLIWTVRRNSEKKLEKDLRDDNVDLQIFIPAGRSFFTSVGKAVSAFEPGGMLDAVTMRFGRIFAAARDREFRVFGGPGDKTDESARAISRSLFGGDIKFDRRRDYVEMDDGRKVPFSALSSGQQELLPLWLALNQYAVYDRRTLAYIEEPEAHLFPSAQGILVEYLAAIANRKNKSLLLTTHSPYVLAKINNLLKAGALAEHHRVRALQIAAVIPRQSWLDVKKTRAYAIKNRRVETILNDDGMIDGAYLDEISGDLEADFSSLLEIEFGDAAHRKERPRS